MPNASADSRDYRPCAYSQSHNYHCAANVSNPGAIILYNCNMVVQSRHYHIAHLQRNWWIESQSNGYHLQLKIARWQFSSSIVQVVGMCIINMYAAYICTHIWFSKYAYLQICQKCVSQIEFVQKVTCCPNANMNWICSMHLYLQEENISSKCSDWAEANAYIGCCPMERHPVIHVSQWAYWLQLLRYAQTLAS